MPRAVPPSRERYRADRLLNVSAAAIMRLADETPDPVVRGHLDDLAAQKAAGRRAEIAKLIEAETR